jgi:precorrin-2 dehydrogenase/sirohydrochlorin ferrochelatase
MTDAAPPDRPDDPPASGPAGGRSVPRQPDDPPAGGRAGERPLYPVNLVLDGKRCLVVGGGRVAEQKVRGLLEGGAVVHVVALALSPVLGELARATPALTVEERAYEPGEVAGYWLAVTATDDTATNQRVHDDGEALRVWVNSADDPAHCSFILPARIRQGPLLVTFSTGGASPAVATWLRRRFGEEFGPEYARLITMLAAERARLKAEGRSTEGLDWQGALDSGMLDLIREGHLAEAKERLQACLSSSSD